MKRSTLRALLIAAVVISVPLVFLRARDRPRLDELIDVSRLDGKALPELLQRIRDFHRVVTRDGKKLLEVSATEASYFRDSSGIQVLEPSLIFFNDGERVGQISGDRGLLTLSGNDVESVKMTGDVALVLVQFEIRADSLTYERARNQIVADGPAVIRSPEVEVAGTGMTLDLASRTLRVDSAVDMTLRPIMEKREGTPDEGAGN